MRRAVVALCVVGMTGALAACGSPKGPARLPPDRSPRVECPPNAAPRPAATVANDRYPGKLSREDITIAMKRIEGDVKACSDMYSRDRTVTVRWEVGADGGVLWAETTGEWAGTWIGYCAAKAVCGASLPASSDSLSVTFPFQL